jgi:hypothetical protein
MTHNGENKNEIIFTAERNHNEKIIERSNVSVLNVYHCTSTGLFY